MRPIVLPLIAVATLAAQPAFAELHKCTTKEGKTIYTEFECEGDAKKSEVTIRDSKGVDSTKGGSPIKPADKKNPETITKTVPAPGAPDKPQALPAAPPK
ncbi:MAG TPA: hypothetical protein VLH12_04385 [Usitatibacter sp.]|nr:hypothetical protein [Usitatibacter sp.]